jgi:hypothetical protein
VIYAFASVAVVTSAVVSGFIGPTLVRRILEAEPSAKTGWEIALRYNGLLIALLSGHLTLGVHGFGLVVLAQASWFIAVGALMLGH